MQRNAVVVLFLVTTFGFVGVAVAARVGWTDPTETHVVTCPNVTGVEVGAPVTLAGFPVGQVQEVRPTAWAPPRFEVHVAVERGVVIAADARAELEPALVGGGGSVRLVQGTSSERLLPGAPIPGGRVQSLPERAGRTLDNMDGTMRRSGASFEKLDRALDATTQAADEVRLGAAEGRAALDAVRPDLQRGAAGLASAMERATAASTRAEALLAEEGEVALTLRQARSELAAAGELMADYEPERSAFMADTLTELNTLLAESARLATRFREQKLLMLVKRDEAPAPAPAVGSPETAP